MRAVWVCIIQPCRAENWSRRSRWKRQNTRLHAEALASGAIRPTFEASNLRAISSPSTRRFSRKSCYRSLEAPDASALANLASLFPAVLRSLTECSLATRQLRQFWRVKLQIAQPAISTIERHQGVVSTLL